MTKSQKAVSVALVAIISVAIGAAALLAIGETIDVLAYNKAGCMLNVACRDTLR